VLHCGEHRRLTCAWHQPPCRHALPIFLVYAFGGVYWQSAPLSPYLTDALRRQHVPGSGADQAVAKRKRMRCVQVRDDWNKFMPTIARADQLAEERAGGAGTGTSSSSSSSGEDAGSSSSAAAAGGAPHEQHGEREAADALQEEIGTPVDVRLGMLRGWRGLGGSSFPGWAEITMAGLRASARHVTCSQSRCKHIACHGACMSNFFWAVLGAEGRNGRGPPCGLGPSRVFQTAAWG
jgi:hypothetical protein